MKLILEVEISDCVDKKELVYEALCNALMGPGGEGVNAHYGETTPSNPVVVKVISIDVIERNAVWGCRG